MRGIESNAAIMSFQLTLSLSKSVLADNIIGRHACLHTEFIHGGDIPFPTEHKLSRLTTPPIEYMLNGYDESALNGVHHDDDDEDTRETLTK